MKVIQKISKLCRKSRETLEGTLVSGLLGDNVEQNGIILNDAQPFFSRRFVASFRALRLNLLSTVRGVEGSSLFPSKEWILNVLPQPDHYSKWRGFLQSLLAALQEFGGVMVKQFIRLLIAINQKKREEVEKLSSWLYHLTHLAVDDGEEMVEASLVRWFVWFISDLFSFLQSSGRGSEVEEIVQTALLLSVNHNSVW